MSGAKRSNTMLAQYSKFVIGKWVLTTQVVCTDGIVRTVEVEQYADGYHAFLKKEDGKYTNHKGYKSSAGAVKASAKF
jgi:hypothetical protein